MWWLIINSISITVIFRILNTIYVLWKCNLALVNFSIGDVNLVYLLWSPEEGRIDFATFLEVMHEHYKVEKYKDEIIDSFKAQDKSGNGTVSAMEMRNILMKIGEKLPASEGNIDRVTPLHFNNYRHHGGWLGCSKSTVLTALKVRLLFLERPYRVPIMTIQGW